MEWVGPPSLMYKQLDLWVRKERTHSMLFFTLPSWLTYLVLFPYQHIQVCCLLCNSWAVFHCICLKWSPLWRFSYFLSFLVWGWGLSRSAVKFRDNPALQNLIFPSMPMWVYYSPLYETWTWSSTIISAWNEQAVLSGAVFSEESIDFREKPLQHQQQVARGQEEGKGRAVL